MATEVIKKVYHFITTVKKIMVFIVIITVFIMIIMVFLVITMSIAMYLASWAVPVMGPLSLRLSFLQSYSTAYLLLQMPKKLLLSISRLHECRHPYYLHPFCEHPKNMEPATTCKIVEHYTTAPPESLFSCIEDDAAVHAVAEYIKMPCYPGTHIPAILQPFCCAQNTEEDLLPS